MASIKEALDNRILGALAIAALVTMITGAINEPGYLGWIQGFSIYIAIFLIVAFTSVNDYIKDKNFVRLASEVKRDCISVTRGKRGVTQTLSIYKLVVGDIVHLEPGCMVPADCLIVSS
jgi:magnesium-transporting ATPase (P-type)